MVYSRLEAECIYRYSPPFCFSSPLSFFYYFLLVYYVFFAKSLVIFIIINHSKKDVYLWKFLIIFLPLKVIFISRGRGLFQLRLCKKEDPSFYHLEEKVFKDCEFLKWFKEASLRSFIYDIPKKMFLILVRMLYSNLKYVRGILTNEVNKNKIRQSLEEFNNICNLPSINSKFIADKDIGFCYS